MSSAQPMSIAVMGAGAVGCYYGGLLARAGHAVTLIGRPQHVAVCQSQGLLLDTQQFRERVPVLASTEASAARDAQLVLFCVKSSDTEVAAAQLEPHLAPDTRLLSLQNGVDNAERLRAALPQPVAGAAVYVATEMAGPGHVKHHGRGELVIGSWAAGQPPRELGPADDLSALFSSAGVPVQQSDNVDGVLWSKLVLNCAYNALSAISQRPYGDLVRSDGVKAVMRDVVLECLAVAKAAGVQLPGDVFDAVERIARTMPTQYSSTAQDLARGRRSEIDHLNGYILRRGEALGVATPVNRALWALVKLLENKPSGQA
jgi:2-dehydropantoate 2-reductase